MSNHKHYELHAFELNPDVTRKNCFAFVAKTYCIVVDKGLEKTSRVLSHCRTMCVCIFLESVFDSASVSKSHEHSTLRARS